MGAAEVEVGPALAGRCALVVRDADRVALGAESRLYGAPKVDYTLGEAVKAIDRKKEQAKLMADTIISKPIISSDSHIMEPPDTYTARIDKKYKDIAPKVVWQEKGGDTYVIDGMKQTIPMGLVAAADMLGQDGDRELGRAAGDHSVQRAVRQYAYPSRSDRPPVFRDRDKPGIPWALPPVLNVAGEVRIAAR